MKDKDSILFEIALHPGNVAICIADHSVRPSESQILIAASTGFKIEGVEYIDVEMQSSDCSKVVTIPVVKMSYFLSWSDFDIDECPPRSLIESDSI
jgi:hypothetical protein